MNYRCAMMPVVTCKRFHDPEEELELSHDVVPYLDDNVQLTVEDYRGRLYEVSGERGSKRFSNDWVPDDSEHHREASGAHPGSLTDHKQQSLSGQ